MKADRIIKSNVVYIGRGSNIISGGVAIKGNKIIAVGSDEELEKHIGSDTEILEYRDCLVMPGFIDDHVHVTMGAMIHDSGLDLSGTRSP